MSAFLKHLETEDNIKVLALYNLPESQKFMCSGYFIFIFLA